ncbi:hypothetical protein HPC49_34235 [Pyxidicoccus fallax]|uniref:Uncharacterized protein n=1 Tax=Pyxidicoccus fallax TaxID=394095 RepID=A0A848LKX8_9BACT|nr:hypothetical protein [Pyxidicoccus fallax]NMO18350.1 hypothetical protein [Pyxidicoccus fallax]NPC83267.1 hypothetical protein [Pyxidicoccus fallax]
MLRQLIWETYGPKDDGSLELALFVIEGLLEVPYNVNHMQNMIILPMDDRVGDLIMLPIHEEISKARGKGISSIEGIGRHHLPGNNRTSSV